MDPRVRQGSDIGMLPVGAPKEFQKPLGALQGGWKFPREAFGSSLEGSRSNWELPRGSRRLQKASGMLPKGFWGSLKSYKGTPKQFQKLSGAPTGLWEAPTGFWEPPPASGSCSKAFGSPRGFRSVPLDAAHFAGGVAKSVHPNCSGS